MPRSIFLGRPWPEPGEPLWLDEDRTWALALLAEEAATCPGCGHPVEEASAAENEFAYVATVYRCHACTAKDSGAQRYEKEKPGLYVGVKRRS